MAVNWKTSVVAKPCRKMKVSLAASDVKLLAASFTTRVLDTWLIAAPVAGSMAAAVTAKRPETEPLARLPVGVSAGRARATLAVPPAPNVTSTKDGFCSTVLPSWLPSGMSMPTPPISETARRTVWPAVPEISTTTSLPGLPAPALRPGRLALRMPPTASVTSGVPPTVDIDSTGAAGRLEPSVAMPPPALPWVNTSPPIDAAVDRAHRDQGADMLEARDRAGFVGTGRRPLDAGGIGVETEREGLAGAQGRRRRR